MRPINLLFALVVTILMVSTSADSASAQTFPCNGPGPGQRQIGSIGGSHGVAYTPICEHVPVYDQEEAEPERKFSPGIVVDNFIAVAGHAKQRDVWATWGQYYLGPAEKVVLDACEKTMGAGCYLMTSGKNMAIAAGVDKNGTTHVAYGENGGKAKSSLSTVCRARKQSCSVIKVFEATHREEPVEAAALLRDDFDKSGTFKSYHFPANSAVAPPRPGQPDVGYGTLSEQDVMIEKVHVKGLEIIHYSGNGTWMLKKTGTKKGLGCSLAYATGEQRIIFSGPTPDDKSGSMIFASASVPATREPRQVKAQLTMSTGSQEIPLIHMPTENPEESILAIPIKIQETLNGFVDQTPYKITLDGKAVIEMQIEGGAKASNAMAHCLTGA